MSTPLDGDRAAARGFTLVELLVTLVLISVLAGLAAPSVTNSLEHAEARRVAREVANGFREARNHAMSRAQVVLAEVETADQGEVVLYRTTNSATNCRDADENDVAEVDRVTVREISGDLAILGHGDGQPDWLCFEPDGEVLSLDAQIIDDDLCEGTNFRLWIGDEGATVDAIDKTCPRTEKQRREQDRSRTLKHFWVVHVPFNGAIRASQ